MSCLGAPQISDIASMRVFLMTFEYCVLIFTFFSPCREKQCCMIMTADLKFVVTKHLLNMDMFLYSM